MIKHWRGITVVAVVLVILAAAGLDHWLPYMLLSHYKFGVSASPQAFAEYGAEFRRFEVVTGDGVLIRGWVVPAPGQAAKPSHSVICLHTLGRTREDMLEIALPIWRRGHQLALIDLRGHGESEGEFFTYGYHEWRDVSATLDFLAQHHPTKHYSLLGASASGAVALAAGSRDPRVRSVITIGTFADLNETIRQQTPLLPEWWRRRAVGRAERLADFSVSDASPVRAVASLGCPVLIVHAEDDGYIPFANAKQLYAAAAEPRQLYPIRNATHATMFAVGGDAMIGEIAKFLAECAGESQPGHAP